MPSLQHPPALPPWLERMFPPGMRRLMVDVGGVHVHVAQWGDPDGRPVVMVHGNPSWGFMYRGVVERLRHQRVRLVVPDLVGLGCSEKPADPSVHTLERHGAWMGRVLERLGLTDLVLVAQDWGGPVGLLATAHAGARVRGLVLCNTVVGPPRPGFRPTAFHRLANLPLLSDALFRLGFPQNLVALAQGRKRSLMGRAGRAYRWPLRRVADRVAPLALARMVPDGPAHRSIPALQRSEQAFLAVNGPVALVWGVQDPVLGSVGRHLARLRPDATLTNTPGGHFLPEEEPAAVAAAISDVLWRVGG